MDLWQRLITVGHAKTNAGTGRVIPMNAELLGVVSQHRRWFTVHLANPGLSTVYSRSVHRCLKILHVQPWR